MPLVKQTNAWPGKGGWQQELLQSEDGETVIELVGVACLLKGCPDFSVKSDATLFSVHMVVVEAGVCQGW